MKSENKGADERPKTPPSKKKGGFNDCEKFLLFFNVVFIVTIAYLLSIVYREKIYYTDCGAYFRFGHREDGVYEIQPTADPASRFNVYCDMKKGGWTVIMRRNLNNMNDMSFKRVLDNYRTGFGNIEHNHWLGLDRIHLMTVTKQRDMMFIIDDKPYQVHDFRVLDQDNHYKLVVMKDVDQMPNGASFTKLNNTFFSAADVDFDLAPNGNCTEAWDGGWWFTNCFDKSVCMTGRGLHDDKGVHKFSNSIMLIK